jgi:hypothetical protein
MIWQSLMIEIQDEMWIDDGEESLSSGELSDDELNTIMNIE